MAVNGTTGEVDPTYLPMDEYMNQVAKVVGYGVEYFPNPDCAALHFTVLLPFSGRLDDIAVKFKDTPEIYEGEKSGVRNELALDLYNTPGVVSVSAHEKYRLQLMKGAAFTWDEVLPVVLEKCKQIFDGAQLNKVMSDRFPSPPKREGLLDWFPSERVERIDVGELSKPDSDQ